MDRSKIERRIKLTKWPDYFYWNTSFTEPSMVCAVQGTSESLPTGREEGVAVILRKKFKILNYFKIFSETSFFLIL
jgi:hypothetical protein